MSKLFTKGKILHYEKGNAPNVNILQKEGREGEKEKYRQSRLTKDEERWDRYGRDKRGEKIRREENKIRRLKTEEKTEKKKREERR
jgi:hypothetical protein